MNLAAASGVLRSGLRGDSRHRGVKYQKQAERYAKYQKPGKEMKEALGFIGTPIFSEDSTSHDAKCVGKDRDRYGKNHQQCPPERFRFEQVTVNHGQGYKRNERTKSAASLYHVKR